jgi:hypothetical protein
MDDATSELHSARRSAPTTEVGAGSQARGNDNCVRWHCRSLQIPPTPLRPHLMRATVRVHEYPDGTLAIFKGPQRLASFPAAPGCAEDLAA